MTYATVRRATRAARAAAVILTAVSCSVYDASLLGNGSTQPGTGGSGLGGHSGTAGEANGGAGRAGFAGKPLDNGGSGDGGMMDAAGASEAGGEGPEAGNGGSGGTTGSAGITGTAGSSGGSGGAAAGSGGSGGSGATAGSSGGSGGSGGSPPATGCAKLSVPMDDMNDRAHFVISLASAIDLNSTTTGIVSMRLYVQAGAAGTVFNYVQDGGFHYLGVTPRPALKSISGWQTLSFNVGAQAPGSSGIGKNDIRRIGIEINAGPDTAGWSNPTVVYIDSITVMTPALSFPLDAMASVNTATNLTSDVAGQVMWLNSGSSDTTAAGVTLTWQMTCP